MQQLKDFFSQNDRFTRHCGIELLEAGSGRARARMKIEEHHFNGVDVVHGGAIFALADFVLAVASNSRGKLAPTINASISFISAAIGGILHGEAEEIAINPKLSTYQVRIVDENGKLIAQLTGTAYRKEETFPPA